MALIATNVTYPEQKVLGMQCFLHWSTEWACYTVCIGMVFLYMCCDVNCTTSNALMYTHTMYIQCTATPDLCGACSGSFKKYHKLYKN